jgi:drug/metabolite transporter (DMT)-like permease
MSPTAHAGRSFADVVNGLLRVCMSGPRRSLAGALLVVAAAAWWGCWSIVFKTAERLSTTTLPAASESAAVFAVMLVTMLPLALKTRRDQLAATTTTAATTLPARTTAQWGLLFLLGVTDGLNALCFFQAMQVTTVAVAVLTHYLTPLIVALLAPLLLGERRRASTFVALAVALTGLVLLLRPWTDVDAGDLEGAGLGALSAVFYAANVFLGKRLFVSFNSFEVAAWPKLTSLLVLGAAAWCAGGVALEADVAAVLAVGGFVCGSLPTVFFYAGLQRIAASQASVLTLVEPLVAVVVGVAVWGERLHGLGVVGAACVLGGAVIIARAR